MLCTMFSGFANMRVSIYNTWVKPGSTQDTYKNRSRVTNDTPYGRIAGMRRNCLMVLSHLILNDMMKVKGHIARLALCLQDDDPRVAGLAQVFFHELSQKANKVTRPERRSV